jgi:hypothetical protein
MDRLKKRKRRSKWLAQQLGLKLSGESISLASFLRRLGVKDEEHRPWLDDSGERRPVEDEVDSRCSNLDDATNW